MKIRRSVWIFLKKSLNLGNTYSFSLTDNTLPLNMFFTINGQHEDNKNIIIHPQIRDYSNNNLENGYKISLVGIDGKPYKGLQVKDIQCFGKGLKLNDAYRLEKSSLAPIKLLPIYGIGEGEIKVYYKGQDNIWHEIPLNINPARQDVITYWNVTGLNGLYTLRLISSVDNGNRINIALKELYLGEKVNAQTNDTFLDSSNGQAKLIIPTGALSEEHIISMDTVDLENLKEIAVLPNIAPIGEVIKLTPDGIQFTNETAFPQLHFTYNKEELDAIGTNPIGLTIYLLKENGELEPINTVRQLIKVEFDATNNVKNEYVVWDSSTALNDDIANLDYTYVRAWAVITHFSYYVVFEGDFSKMPSIDQKSTATADLSFTATGKSAANTELQVYVTQSPILITADNLQPVKIVRTNNTGNFTAEEIPLPFENKNYIYIGQTGSKPIEYNKIVITRDTTAPQITVMDYNQVISPNNDDKFDSTTLIISSSEDATLNLTMVDQESNISVLSYDAIVSIQTNATIVIDGHDPSGFLLPDKEYRLIVTAIDKLGNIKTINNLTISIDTSAPHMDLYSILPMGRIVSPANLDGFFDSLSAELRSNEEAIMKVSVVSEQHTELVQITQSLSYEMITSFTFNGQNNFQQNLPDGTYFIKANGNDKVGNEREMIFTDTPFTIDNTAPRITILNPKNEKVITSSIYKINFTVNENSLIKIKVYNTMGEQVYILHEQIFAGENSFNYYVPEDLPEGFYTINITGIDLLNNETKQISYYIEITHDNIPPELNIPDDIIIEATDTFMYIDIGTAIATDQSPPITIGNNSLISYPLGETIITWKASDRYGNTCIKEQKIIVIDTTPPDLTIPEDIVIEATGIYTPLDIGEAYVFEIFNYELSNDAPLTFPLGLTRVTWIAIDANGNKSTKIQAISVIDSFSPIITIEGIKDNADYTDNVTPIINLTDNESGISSSSILLDGQPSASGISITSPGEHTLNITCIDYAGNKALLTINFKIYSSTSMTIIGNPVQYSDRTTITGTLIKGTVPVAGKKIQFLIDNVVIGSSITQVNGVASIEYTILRPIGTYNLTACFSQDETDFLRGVTGAGTLQVDREKTVVNYTGDSLIQFGNNIVLKAYMEDDADGNPGDRSVCRIKFDINKIDEYGNLHFINSYIIQCDEAGIASTLKQLAVGLYSIKVEIIEEGYYLSSFDNSLVVVYDSSSNSVTGGGWINVTNFNANSQGKGNFGFNAKYKDDQATGHLEFQNKDYGIDLKSTKIDWLIINTNSAQFQGTCTIKNKTGIFSFRVSCIDNGTFSQPDQFTIRIWEGNNTEQEPIYFNLNQNLSGGNINVHSN